MINFLAAGGGAEGWEHFSDETLSSQADQDGDHGFPKLARCRGNLTTLSQRYNVCESHIPLGICSIRS